MVKVTSDCKQCMHAKTCRFKDNPKMIADKLCHTQFGNGPNDDYGWDIMSDHYHVNITISCPDYRPEVATIRTPQL